MRLGAPPLWQVAIENEEPFTGVADGRVLAQAIVDTIREPLLVLDKDLRVIAASRSFYLTFKLSRQDVQGLPLYTIGGGQWNSPGLKLLLERILPQHSEMEAYEVEHDFTGLGRRTMLLNARTVIQRDSEGQMILLAMEDVTDARNARLAAQELLEQKEMLLQEMQHRVANSLQIIASILLLKARTVQSAETKLHLHDAHKRVLSVAAVQKQLQATRHGERVEIGPYFSLLCESLASSMIGGSRPVVLTVQAGAGAASSNDAVSFGLIVTELVINSLKHAFAPDLPEGRIVVAWESLGAAWRLSVSDNGHGKNLAADSPARPGLGTSIVEALASQLDAEVEISSGRQGMQVSITHGTMPARLTEAA